MNLKHNFYIIGNKLKISKKIFFYDVLNYKILIERTTFPNTNFDLVI